MEKILFADIGGSTLAESLETAGSSVSWETWKQGDVHEFGFRLCQKVGKEYVEVERDIVGIRAKLGRLYLKPESGTTRLWIGDANVAPVEGTNLTAPIDLTAGETAFAAALNALSIVGPSATYGTASVTMENGHPVVIFDGETDEVPIRGYEVRFKPISFVRVQASDETGDWTHKIVFDQAGLAFADQYEAVLPDPPVVSEFRAGTDNSNEIQEIEFNPFFRGLYEVRWNGKVSSLLNRDDGPDEFSDAIAELADEDGEFIVSNPEPGYGHVEFSGSMGATNQDLLEIRVVKAPPGDETIRLDLSKKTTADVLAEMDVENNEVTVPFEVELRYRSPSDENKILTWSYQEPVTVRRQLIAEGEATVNDIDYLRPVDPRSYVPFIPTQISNGQDFYPFEIGDGTATEFTVDHQLHTRNVGVDLKEKVAGGKFLNRGTDYKVSFDDIGPGEDAIVITLLGDYATTPPALNALFGEVVSRETTSVLDVHGHTIEQSVGLREELDEMWEDINFLKSKLLREFRSNADGESSFLQIWDIPRFLKVFPVLDPTVTFTAADTGSLSGVDLSVLPFAPELFAAIHADSTSTLSVLPAEADGTVLPAPGSNAEIGLVFQNQSGGDVFLESGSGYDLPDQGFAAWNGEVWYPLEQFGSGESSYYPAQLTQELWRDVIEPEYFAAGRRYSKRFRLGTKTHEANTLVYCHLVIEVANLTADATPGTPGGNLKNDDWEIVPVLSQALTLSSTERSYLFGYRLTRATDDTLTAEVWRGGDWEPAVEVPDSPRFGIRARVIRFDVENDVASPAGTILLSGPSGRDDGEIIGVSKIE